MQAFKSTIVTCQLHRRLFSTSSWNCRRVGWTVEEVLALRGPRCLKPHKILWKFIERAKNKGIFSNPPVGFPSLDLESAITSIACRRIPVTRKSAILNNTFMRNITEILATSDVGLPLVGHDVQISHVKVTPDFQAVNVFWIPQGTDADDEIQQLLNKTANPLRRELINLRTMGLVPIIYFVKDKHYALKAEVDRRLRIADFGEDHVPALLQHHSLKDDLQLITSLPGELKEQIANLEEKQPFEDTEKEELPEMRLDVFGLNYNKILQTVKLGVTKSCSSDEKLTEDIFNNPKAVFEVSSNKILDKEPWDKAGFKKYIKQRKNKIKKAQRAMAKDMEILHTHYIESYVSQENDSELYNEFVENAFEDSFENINDFDQHHENHDSYEQEQQ